MATYYNEIDKYAAAWLRELIKQGLIAHGEVDERSIVDVQPSDLRGFDQCHFFAGIGGWSYALRLANWPDHRPVWTGSCPCQPFSVAGQQRGSEDERHLWPAWFRLIGECRPPTIFGEQVAGAAGLAWLDHVLADLESEGYAAASADLPACSVGAPHRRQRLWFVADSGSQNVEGFIEERSAVRSNKKTTKQINDYGCLDPWIQLSPDQLAADATDGISRPVAIVRGYGNAIVPPLAAEFIKAYLDI